MKIAIDGNIGVGKSTLIKNLCETNENFIAHKEEINHDILSKCYNEVLNNEKGDIMTMLAQTYFLLSTKIRDVCATDNTKINIFDRSAFATSEIFSKLMLNEVDHINYQQINNMLNINCKYDIVIILICDADINMERIKTRNREYELAIDYDYLETLENMHRSAEYYNILSKHCNEIYYIDVSNLTPEEVLKRVLFIIKNYCKTILNHTYGIKFETEGKKLQLINQLLELCEIVIDIESEE